LPFFCSTSNLNLNLQNWFLFCVAAAWLVWILNFNAPSLIASHPSSIL
jgi:hypothetical protein